MTIRKKHNAILTALVILGIIFLFSQKYSDEQDLDYNVIEPLPTSNQHEQSVPQVPTPQTPGQVSPPVEPPSPFLPFPPAPAPAPADTKPLEFPPALPPTLPPAFPPAPADHVAMHQEGKMPFQEDLDIDFPFSTIQQYKKYKPHNYNPGGPKTNAFALLLSGKNPSLKDPYFLAIQQIVYRLLWAQRSRTVKYPVIVFVLPSATAEQRDTLAGAGAIVRELEPVEWNPKTVAAERWRDLFVKLRMWKEIEFERLLFLDADAFPLTNIDDIFTAAPAQECKGDKMTLDDLIPSNNALCEPYVFAGVAQDPFTHPDSAINVGVMLFSPSLGMYERLLQNYVKYDRYDTTVAEQNYLDWQFRLDGPFPPYVLDRKWGAHFPQEDEGGKVNVVHQKIWIIGPEWAMKDWTEVWTEMVAYYQSDDFKTSRQADGVGEYINL